MLKVAELWGQSNFPSLRYHVVTMVWCFVVLFVTDRCDFWQKTGVEALIQQLLISIMDVKCEA